MKTESQFRVENVCESAAIFSIKRSWERNSSESPIISTVPESQYNWKEPEIKKDAAEENELEFLNQCYQCVKKKIKHERRRNPAQKDSEHAIAEDQKLD